VGNFIVRWQTAGEDVPVSIIVAQASLMARTRPIIPKILEGRGGHKVVRLDAGAVAIAVVIIPRWGYWSAYGAVPTDDTTIELLCPPIDCNGALGWWHECLAISTSDITRGQNIRVGVIDFHVDPARVAPNVTLLPSPAPPAKIGQVLHGEHVLSLMSAHSGEHAFEGVAPGASYFFAGAASQVEEDAMLSVPYVYEQIDALTSEHDVHLINLSAGMADDPSGLLAEAIELAYERGTLCMVAAGNTGPAVVYPARLPRAVAVGAYGRHGVTPDNVQTSPLAQHRSASKSTDGSYMLDLYAFSPEINLVAPGIGVLPSAAGRLAEQNGTSFAAPLATGVLASILAEDPIYLASKGTERSARALEVLRTQATCPSGLACGETELLTIRLPARGC
jgi:hypothetical protein